MGAGQSANLVKAGFTVRGYDIDAAAVARLGAAGGQAAATPAEAARDADLLFVLVFSAEQAETVLFGSDGAVETLPPGAIVVLHTTGAPSDAERIAARLEETGHRMLDAPVTGGKSGADDGTLTAIISGGRADLDRARPALEAMCKTIFHVGDRIGAASTVKMINQLLVGIHGVAAAEAVALAERAGADPAMVYDVITSGSANSVCFERVVPLMLANDFESRGATAIMVKDLGNTLDAARGLSTALPLTAGALQQYLATAAQGHLHDDLASVIEVYRRTFGTD
jgi:3-hydroxyisobutyrate dehydrogenase